MNDPIENLLSEYVGRDYPAYVSLHGESEAQEYYVLRVREGTALLQRYLYDDWGDARTGMKRLVRLSAIASVGVPQ